MPKKLSIDSFLTDITGKRGDLSDVDNIISASGDLRKLEGVDVVIKRLANVFMISRGTYFFDPDFGTGLYQFIFEKTDITTKHNIDNLITNAIKQLNISTAVIDHEVLFFNDKKGFRINLTISYQGEKKTVAINIDENILKTINS